MQKGTHPGLTVSTRHEAQVPGKVHHTFSKREARSAGGFLVDKTLEVGSEKTKKAIVNRALREFIVRRATGAGTAAWAVRKIDWDNEYDYKRERTRR